MPAEIMRPNYVPTSEERRNVVMPKDDDHLMLSGDGVFSTLQGEGVTAGLPAVFLRLHHCNLACGKSGGWQCDTWYTWDVSTPEYWREPSVYSIDETRDSIESAWAEAFAGRESVKRLVITGGEPLMQQTKLARLTQGLADWAIEIETNGTIRPGTEFSDFQINCSPKLANSGNVLKKRYKPDVLRAINKLPNSWFKFVVTKASDLEEVSEVVEGAGLNKEKILIMPEGQTAETVEQHARDITKVVGAYGWQLIMRNQLIWFGDQRMT